MNFPVFPAESTSLAAKHLTEPIFNALKEKKTGMGFSLAQALTSGITHRDSDIGVYAGDAGTYTVFSPLLLPIIQEYHCILPGTVHESDLSLAHLPDLDPARRYILSTRIRVARNLAGFAFTPFIRREERKKVEQIIVDTLKHLPAPLSGDYIPMNPEENTAHVRSVFREPGHPISTARHDDQPEGQAIKPLDYAGIKKNAPEKGAPEKNRLPEDPEKAFLFNKGDRFQDAASINRDWPHARGCFVSHDTRFRVWINEEDHLRIISMDDHGDMATTFNRIALALGLLEEKLDFARNNTLGYLAACPSNIGTGMRAGVHIRLPRLIKQQEMLHAQARRLNLQIRGTRGEKTRVEEGVLDVSNRQRLGITEKTCLQTLYRGVSHLIRLEKAAQSYPPSL